MSEIEKTLQALQKSIDGSFKSLNTALQNTDQKVSMLSDKVSAIEGLVGTGVHQTQHTELTPEIQVFVDSVASERKPYLLKMSGIVSASYRVSPVRAAILLVLLTDLGERLEGRPGIQDRQAAITQAFLELDTGRSDASSAHESTRVALYRFKDFFNETTARTTGDIKLHFDSDALELVLLKNNTPVAADSASINITTNDTTVTSVIEGISHASLLRSAYKRGAVFVPPGPSGYDKLLLELFDHDSPVNAVTTYFRPSSVSYPRDLLEKMSTSSSIFKRWDIAIRGFTEHSFNYVEVLNFSALWNFIRITPDERFLFHSELVDGSDVISHLRFIRENVKRYPTYKLVLSNAVFPFYLGLFELQTKPIPKSITVFFRQLESNDPLHDISCLVVADKSVYQAMNERVIRWILDHPSTITNREEVITALDTVIDYFASKGHLEWDEPVPDI